ncbi:hypothetical protein Ah1_00093 [Aeromonas phage Ah1]|uniref:Uncharacterized protein n=1 Tax=Aeromonas phage Ah1 TaxID=2053701 RepID=A0A2H4YF80_9CAUD|nr:hypothetical protein KNT77_gp093 [Aeromonas phage Ah1]AUE22634.1 hypothetical protein Ah1_00093 [Aeromonas phage Ah1]
MQNVNHKHKVGTLVMVTAGKFAGVFGKVTGLGKSKGNTPGTIDKVYPTYTIGAMWYMDSTGCYRRLAIRRPNSSVSVGYIVSKTLNNLGETQITEVMNLDIIRSGAFTPKVENFTGGAIEFSKSFPYIGHEFPMANVKMEVVAPVAVKPVEHIKIETKIAQASGFDASEFYVENNGKMVPATEETIREIMKTLRVTEVPVFAKKVVSVFDLI